jgi:hypothetical protein
MTYQIRPIEPIVLVPLVIECLQHPVDSSTPPPALLPLLTPILQQRFNLLSHHSGPWLHLLNWNRELADKLPMTVQRADLDLEYDGTDRVCYRRLDPETILARVEAKEYGLLLTYLWCMDSEQNATLGLWMLQELRCLEDEDEMSKWSESLQAAEVAYQSANSSSNARTNGKSRTPMPYDAGSTHTDDEDDDSYWNSYDMTPGQSRGRTPAKNSPAPTFLQGGVPNRLPSRSAMNESEYFERYMDVQPALDPYDPEEDSTGQATQQNPGRHLVSLDTSAPRTSAIPNGASVEDHDDAEARDEDDDGSQSLRQPRPTSASSSSSHAQASPHSVAKLEDLAAGHSHAEIGVKQHISTDLKSLYRLAKSAGIEREEFVRIINRELEILPLLDME